MKERVSRSWSLELREEGKGAATQNSGGGLIVTFSATNVLVGAANENRSRTPGLKAGSCIRIMKLA